MEDPQIQKLLRLKRFEQPPPGYFDSFLERFQERQRTELLKQPLWELLVERITLQLEAFRVPALAYCGVLVAAVAISVPMLQDNDGGQATLAVTQPAAITTMSLASKNESADLGEVPSKRAPSSLPPQYVLQSRPVSYDSSLSF